MPGSTSFHLPTGYIYRLVTQIRKPNCKFKWAQSFIARSVQVKRGKGRQQKRLQVNKLNMMINLGQIAHAINREMWEMANENCENVSGSLSLSILLLLHLLLLKLLLCKPIKSIKRHSTCKQLYANSFIHDFTHTHTLWERERDRERANETESRQSQSVQKTILCSSRRCICIKNKQQQMQINKYTVERATP